VAGRVGAQGRAILVQPRYRLIPAEDKRPIGIVQTSRLYSQPAIRYLAVSSALAAAISGKIGAAMKVGACKLHNS
jgi:hypothetical protein